MQQNFWGYDTGQEYRGGGSRNSPSLITGLGAALRFVGRGLTGILLIIPADINGSLGLIIGLLGTGDLGAIEARLMTPIDNLAYARSFSSLVRERLLLRSGFGDVTVGSMDVRLSMPTEYRLFGAGDLAGRGERGAPYDIRDMMPTE